MIVQATPRSVLNVFLRHKRLFVLISLMPVVLAAAYCAVAPRTYRSEAVLVARFAGRSTNKNTLPDVALPGDSIERQTIFNSNVKLLNSADLLDDLLAQLDLAKLYPKLAALQPDKAQLIERARGALSRDFKVTADRESNVMELSLDNSNPEIAASSLGELIKLFIKRQTKVYRNPQADLMRVQADEMRERLARSQDNLDKFMAKFGITSLDDERAGLLKLQMDTRGALGQQQAKLGEAQGRRAAVIAALSTLEPQISVSDESDRYRAVDEARSRLSNLTAKLAELHNYQAGSQTLGSLTPQIESAQRELAMANHNAEARARTQPNPVYQQAQTDLVHADQEINAARGAIAPLEQQLARYEERLAELSSQQAEYRTLIAQRQVDEEGYHTALQRADDARTADLLQQENVNGAAVLQAPTVPTAPISPRVGPMLALAVQLGLLLGAFACFIAEKLDKTFSLPDQVEPILQLPVLAAARTFHKPRSIRTRPALRIQDASQAHRAALPAPVVPRSLPAPNNPEYFSRMELVSLFRSAASLLDHGAPRILQIMSSIPGEGTSTVARELAAVVERTVDLRVLLVTMTRGSHLAAANSNGTLLGGDPLDSVLVRVPGEPYLTAEMGILEQWGSHSFEPTRLHALFERLLTMVDVIIIDAAPALAEYSGLATVSYVGGVILVVEAERTPASVVHDAREMIEVRGGRVLGIFLNRRHSRLRRLGSRGR